MKFFCTNCGAEYLKWSGKCSACGEWETLKEVEEIDEKIASRRQKTETYKLSDLSKKTDIKERILSGYGELDRVLGGGIVNGSLVLIAGEPGIGKSTLLTQVALTLSSQMNVLYISGEESPSQVYSRIQRFDNNKPSKIKRELSLSSEVNVESIIDLIDDDKPDMVIIDSIQSLFSDTVRSYAGSIGQVRVCGAKLTHCAKQFGIPIFLVGQITKEGNVAGPKVLEHIVDTVLYFEGGEYNVFRILRSVKNRFGATNEIGVFEMTSRGLLEIGNPSKAFLDEGNWGVGSAIGGINKGSRVVFVEVQALVVERGAEVGPLRRVANGIKKPRLDMLCAVMSKRGGVFLGDKDVFVNVVGGIEVGDPSLDLAVCAAIKAACKERELDRKALYYGEVGLTGEVREGISADSIKKEAKRVGYKVFVFSKGRKNIRDL